MKSRKLWAMMLCLLVQPLAAGCYKCEEIKERNKNLPPLKYEYYDDYLEALKAEGNPIPEDIDFGDENEKKPL